MKSNGGGPAPAGSRPSPDSPAVPLVIATSLRQEGITGVHTHVRQLRRYLAQDGTAATLITPFSWGGFLSVPVFGLRRVLKRSSRPARPEPTGDLVTTGNLDIVRNHRFTRLRSFLLDPASVTRQAPSPVSVPSPR